MIAGEICTVGSPTTPRHVYIIRNRSFLVKGEPVRRNAMPLELEREREGVTQRE